MLNFAWWVLLLCFASGTCETAEEKWCKGPDLNTIVDELRDVSWEELADQLGLAGQSTAIETGCIRERRAVMATCYLKEVVKRYIQSQPGEPCNESVRKIVNALKGLGKYEKEATNLIAKFKLSGFESQAPMDTQVTEPPPPPPPADPTTSPIIQSQAPMDTPVTEPPPPPPAADPTTSPPIIQSQAPMDTPVTKPPPPPADPTPSPPIEINLSALLDLIKGTWSPEILGVMMQILETHPKLNIILTVIIALVTAIVVYYKCGAADEPDGPGGRQPSRLQGFVEFMIKHWWMLGCAAAFLAIAGAYVWQGDGQAITIIAKISGHNLSAKRGIAILITCDYRNPRNPHINPLPSTNRDADEMRKTFEMLDYDVYQLQNENVTLDRINATLTNVSQYLDEYNGSTTNKVIVFAFSGHGTHADQIITQDDKQLSLKTDIIPPLVHHENVYKIPKLFFIDACRGNEKLQAKNTRSIEKDMNDIVTVVSKGLKEYEGNYRIDYATIPGHVAYESKWMPVVAQKLREENDTLQNIMATVKKEVSTSSVDGGGKVWQQCVSRDLLITGPLTLHP